MRVLAVAAVLLRVLLGELDVDFEGIGGVAAYGLTASVIGAVGVLGLALVL